MIWPAVSTIVSTELGVWEIIKDGSEIEWICLNSSNFLKIADVCSLVSSKALKILSSLNRCCWRTCSEIELASVILSPV